MTPAQFASPLIDQTISAFNGDVTAVSPMDGLKLIDTWIGALHSDTQTPNPVVTSLNELRLLLQNGLPGNDPLQSVLHDLTNQTRQAAVAVGDAGQQASLSQLADALGSFGDQLAGKRGPAQTGGNATAGPTVGGISSNAR